MGMLTPPARRRGTELLDDPKTGDDDRERAMRDLARSNRLFQGTASVARALRDVWPMLPARATLLDVGTGMGDIPAAVATDARRRGVTLSTVGVDSVPHQATLARPRVTHAVAGDALALPFADRSADVVTCSQVLHHFFDDEPRALIAELHRVSRDWIVVAELRRNRLAALGFRLASRVFGFHPITRADGVASIHRGFTAAELDRLVTEVTGVRPVVRQGIFWRLTATWRRPPVR
jgi:SAM-dependent methyltransferase